MKKIGNFLFLSLILLSSSVQAAISVKSELHPDQVGLGDQARVILTISSDEDFEVQDPDFPKAEGLQILQAQNAGKSSSSRMSITNGKTEFSKTIIQNFDYIVQFTQKGLVTIPSISVNVNGQVSATAPIRVQVAATPMKNQRPRQPIQPDDPMGVDDDMFSQLMQRRQQILEDMQRQMGAGGGGGQGFPGGLDPQQIPELKLDVNTNESFFVYADTNKTKAYEGEQITTNWYIYVKGNIEAIDRAKFPDLKGFWKEIIEEVPGLQFSSAVVNGIPYKRALLASHALFPIKAGTAVIDEFKIKATIRNQTQFGWGQPHEFTKASRRLAIQVLPLPQEGKPLSFSGAVGQFQIQTQVESLQVKAGQPFSLKIRFEGQGNAKLIELPPIQWPESLTVFDTKSESKFFKNGQSFKEFEVLLIQSQEGAFKIPAVNFSYFDPEQKNYVTKSTEELQLNAIKSDQPVSGRTGQTDSNKAAEVKAADYSPQLEWPGSFSWMASRGDVFSTLALAIIIFLTAQFGWQYSKINSRPSLQVKVNAKIKKIETSVKNKNVKSVGAETVNLIYLLLEGVNPETQLKSADPQDVMQRLAELPLHYKAKYQARLTDIFQYFQMIGFAPDEVRENLLKQKDLDREWADLKAISQELAEDLGRAT